MSNSDFIRNVPVVFSSMNVYIQDAGFSFWSIVFPTFDFAGVAKFRMCWAFSVQCCHQGILDTPATSVQNTHKNRSVTYKARVRLILLMFFSFSLSLSFCRTSKSPINSLGHPSPYIFPLNFMQSFTLTHMQECSWHCCLAGQTHAGLSHLKCGSTSVVVMHT